MASLLWSLCQRYILLKLKRCVNLFLILTISIYNCSESSYNVREPRTVLRQRNGKMAIKLFSYFQDEESSGKKFGAFRGMILRSQLIVLLKHKVRSYLK